MNEPFLLVSPKIIISSSEPFALLMLRVEGVAQCPLRRMNTRQCRHLLDTAFGGSAHSYTKGRAILHSIFAYGLRQEWCSENPVKRIGMPRLNEKEIIPLTPAEIRRLQQTAQQPQHREMLFSLHLMVYGGVRPTEVSRLTEDCIQPDRNRVIIPPSGSKTGGGRVNTAPQETALAGCFSQHSPQLAKAMESVATRCRIQLRAMAAGCMPPHVCQLPRRLFSQSAGVTAHHGTPQYRPAAHPLPEFTDGSARTAVLGATMTIDY